jgi:transcriptional regulator with GAF, ATPase, and Fis domain
VELSFEEMERMHIISVLDSSGWRVRGKKGAAERLNLKPSTLESKMKKLGIKRTILTHEI